MSDKKDRIVERHLLWLIANDADWLAKFAEYVDPTYWENVEDRWLVSQCLDFWRKYESPLPPETLLTLLEDKREDDRFSKEIVEERYDGALAPDESVYKWLMDYSLEYFQRQKTEQVIAAVADIYQNDGRLDEAIDVLSSGLEVLRRNPEEIDSFNVTADPVGTFEWLEDTFVNREPGLLTLLPRTDEALDGGLRNGELGVVLAPPGHGKSQVLVFIARQAWKQGKNVVYVSFEMSKERVAARFLSDIINQDANQVPYTKDHGIQLYKSFIKKNNLTANFAVVRYPTKSATVMDIRAYLKDRQKEFPVDLVVVDYGDIVKPSRRFEQPRLEQSAIYDELRQMAIEMNIPVWTASQANRAALRRKRITIEHIGDSFDKAKVADYIVALCQTDEEKANDLARFFFAKTRNTGIVEDIYLRIEFARSRFEEIDKSEAEDILKFGEAA